MARSKEKISGKKADTASKEMHEDIICPLTLEATTKINHDPKAINYGVEWKDTMAVDGQDEPGCWYSAQTSTRGHFEAFTTLLDERKALPEDDPRHISWDEQGYYFSHEEGVKAREKYEQMVLAGETTVEDDDGNEITIPVKANAKSWRNKHADRTGVTFEELQERFPELYKTGTTAAETEDDEDQQVEGELVDEEATEPTDEELADETESDDDEGVTSETEDETEHETEEEPEHVAAVSEEEGSDESEDDEDEETGDDDESEEDELEQV